MGAYSYVVPGPLLKCEERQDSLPTSFMGACSYVMPGPLLNAKCFTELMPAGMIRYLRVSWVHTHMLCLDRCCNVKKAMIRYLRFPWVHALTLCLDRC